MLPAIACLEGCASLYEAIFGYGPLEDDPQLLHESARADIEASETALLERREPLSARAATGVRKLRLLRRIYTDYGDPEELDFLQIRGRFAGENEDLGLRELEAFVQKYPLRREREIRELVFAAGEYLLSDQVSERIFTDEKALGVKLLEFLTTHYPSDQEVVPFALRLLGRYYYTDEEDYGEALLAYAKLVDSQRPNQWTDFARYMIPLCLLRSIRSPDYDAEALWHAQQVGRVRPRENGLEAAARLFRDYLQGAVRGANTVPALRALDLTETMLAERERSLADFYRVVGRDKSMAEHLRRARTHQDEVDRIRVELEGFDRERKNLEQPTRGAPGKAAPGTSSGEATP